MATDADVDEDKRLLYHLFFAHLNLDQAGFAAATRTAASQVSACLHGKRTVPDTVLEAAADAVRFPRSLLRPALRAVRSYRAATRGWSRLDPVMTETFFHELLAWSGEALDAIFEAAAPPPPSPKHVEPTETEAAALWTRLERRTPGQRIAMVEEIGEFQSRTLADLVAAKSREMEGSKDPDKARELADLARRISARTRTLPEADKPL